ncbi:MAG TPA: FkbM family methyltransferase [Saprospiraceae bacterium]|nr:FkbM family methyltransferase [Saprospiraceae bacterium]
MNIHFFKKWYPKIFARPIFAKMNMTIARYGLRGLGILNYSSHELTGESHFLSWFINNYSPKTIFDVGANKGDYSELCRKYGFIGHIYGFEPNPITYKKLKALETDKNHFFNIGFSNKPGSFELFYEKGKDESTHATLYKESIPADNTKIVSCEIELKTVDQFVHEQNIKNIDLLKIDTEGNEYKILIGAKKTIEADIIRAIQIEITGINVISRVFFKDFFDLLSPKYNFFRLLPNSFLPIDEYNEFLFLELFAYQNIIAIKKR